MNQNKKQIVFAVLSVVLSVTGFAAVLAGSDWIVGKIYYHDHLRRAQEALSVGGKDVMAIFNERRVARPAVSEDELLKGTGMTKSDGEIYEDRQKFAPTNSYAKFDLYSPKGVAPILRAVDFTGKYFNSSGGMRSTVNAPNAGRPFVFVSGGSTVFCGDTTDKDTLPSRISANWAQASGQAPTVFNLGSNAQYSDQELLRIIYELKDKKPDHVIVYDGINELIIKVFYRLYGAPEKEVFDKRVRRQTALGNLLARSNIYRIIKGVDPLSEDDINSRILSLSRAVAEQYVRNLNKIQSIGTVYGFETWFFLQPVIYSRNSLSDRELSIIEKTFSPLQNKVYLLGYPEIRKAFREFLASSPNVKGADVSDLFDNADAEVFRDHFHLLPQGNDIAAQKIVSVINDNGGL